MGGIPVSTTVWPRPTSSRFRRRVALCLPAFRSLLPVLSLGLTLLALTVPAQAAEVTWQGDTSSRQTVFALPNEPVELILDGDDSSSEPQFETESGTVQKTSNGWRWRPDAEATARVTLLVSRNGATLTVHLFVLTPFDAARQTHIGEFEIGQYPPPTTISEVAYTAPRGLLRVTESTQDLHVSEHFRLRQFLCKQEGDWPKYIATSARLYSYLEEIHAHVVSKGIVVDTLHVMSGYRTPYYNASIDNVEYSRHIYGDAADIFVDTDDDGHMDDIDGNGSVDIGDAELLAEWIREALTASGQDALPGGLGIYAERSWRGPFVHFDVRGFEATWTSR